MWKRRVVSNAEALRTIATSKYASLHCPAPMAGMLIKVSDPARRSTNGFAESHTNVTVTLVVATLLHTRAPTGKFAGPVAGLLLSRPTTFHAIGATVNVVAACAAAASSIAS